MVRRWRSWFLEGRQNVHDDERSGRPVTDTDNAAVATVRNVMEADRRVTIDEIMIRMPPGIKIGRSLIGTIMSDVLNFRKVCAKWVPRLLSENHKQQRMEAARAFLEMNPRDGNLLFFRIVTGDESWVHHSTSETKRQSMVWKKPEESAPKKAKVTISAGKVMAIVFWDSLKLHLGGKHFANDDDVQAEANHWLRRQDTAWYNSGIKILLQWYQNVWKEMTYQVLMKKISQLKEDIHRSHLKISLAIVLVLKTDDRRGASRLVTGYISELRHTVKQDWHNPGNLSAMSCGAVAPTLRSFVRRGRAVWAPAAFLKAPHSEAGLVSLPAMSCGTVAPTLESFLLFLLNIPEMGGLPGLISLVCDAKIRGAKIMNFFNTVHHKGCPVVFPLDPTESIGRIGPIKSWNFLKFQILYDASCQTSSNQTSQKLQSWDARAVFSVLFPLRVTIKVGNKTSGEVDKLAHIHVKCNSTCVRSVVMKSNREFENRAAIIVALRAGRSPKEIVDFLKLPKTTIYRVKKQFDEADSNKEGIATRKKHSRRSDRVRGEEFVKNVKEKIDGNPGKSMRAIGKEMDVGSMTIVRTIHEDLGLKSYALRKGQLLTENMKNNRKGKAAALLNNLKHDSFGMLRFFSDEKNFDVDQKVNPRNDRWICKDPSEIPVVMHTKFPASVMVLGVISSEGDVMPPHFFEKGLRMNADTYINVLETVVKPWMDMVAAGRKTISRRLVANGLHSCRPLRRLPLTPPNRRQRLEWCRARSTWMTEWHRVVFSDESRFCLSSDSRRVRVWRRRGERSNPAAIVERPTVRQHGIMVWGAIAYDSRSPLLRIQGTMTAQRYVDDVLRPVTLPCLQGIPNTLYQQDNARPHTARISQQALQDVQMLPWPPYSPDLSPIEHVWDIIGRRLHALQQPRSEDEL
ncbi:hypothetical protein LAZ67_11001054 [Cordylochernes scorpioides]|uniref:Transposase n=1 Tax=Cordylochernes scorpioides TaxID=51811 RepID=A0ABY6L0Z1_9ARAC|nr:hypothetical protein LAZ67_11001054 [Cordylochernes scorpioides]